jgi:ABC-type phosphate transport system substrate-binding protein
MKLRLNKTMVGAAACAVALVTLGTSMAPASADPVAEPLLRPFAGVGSDTTYNVMNALAETVAIDGNLQIGSYDPIPSSSLISTKDAVAKPNCQNLTRPNGSSAGRTALLDSLTAGNAREGCFDWARSSSLSTTPVAAATGGLTYIPYGLDTFSYAVAKGSLIPRNLTLAQVQAIYKCQVPNRVAYIPQAGSGTRQYWLQQMGITEQNLTDGLYPCIKDTKNSQPVQEHDGRVLTKNNEIVPFSVANFVAQGAGVQTDLRGKADLGNLAGISPLSANANASLSRLIYNIVPTKRITSGDPAYDANLTQVFVGPNSEICKSTSVLGAYGFASIGTDCGDTSRKALPTG